ncbi:CRISPR-associated endonuclease Cas2 [Cloacibacillus sp. An23]|uniref:CRISPR-associated endonuclease Cas2 n=1 Tax=Cloacibacillus sp. An23 TaxID=1965591 RepID=UPI000B3A2730|nr:CRISPR-associated endonuclease Cas2 [Cloacibacillus sp. An23]OUO94107.1 CRISPR-associated endonuclease Cas2 [Cloacibacillus sp. An23]
MLVVVSYDVNTQSEGGQKRLRRVAKLCEKYGQRVQFSVFECLVDPVQWTELKFQLEKMIDKETDSLRYYFLGANWKKRVEHCGAKEPYDPQGVLIL